MYVLQKGSNCRCGNGHKLQWTPSMIKHSWLSEKVISKHSHFHRHVVLTQIIWPDSGLETLSHSENVLQHSHTDSTRWNWVVHQSSIKLTTVPRHIWSLSKQWRMFTDQRRDVWWAWGTAIYYSWCRRHSHRRCPNTARWEAEDQEIHPAEHITNIHTHSV